VVNLAGISSSFEISIDFDPTAEEYILTVPETNEGIYKDAFALVLNPDGEFKEALNFGGWNNDRAYGIAVSGSKILMLGNFAYEASSGACSATVNSDGEPYSDDVFAICFSSNYLSVGETRHVNTSIYPNPADKFININFSKLESFGQVKIKLYDMQSRVIKQTQMKHQQAIYMFDCSTLENGTYLLSIESRDFFTTKKIIVSH
jgi:hypothetical protein